MGWITALLDQYGYLVLFVTLMIELIAFGLPVELLMSYVGFLIFQGKLNWGLSIIIAGTGSAIGMSIAYWIGFKLGNPFFHKYGRRIHMGPERLDQVSHWFEKYGNKVLLVAYFVPGLRHVTGYFSGITRLPFRTYALFAYTGALLWVTTFISLGKLLGPQWEQFHNLVKKYLVIASILIAVAIILLYLYKNNRANIKAWALLTIDRAVETFHSLGRVKMLVSGMAVLFLILLSWMIGLTQDYLANEFDQFNQVSMILVNLMFGSEWTTTIAAFGVLSSLKLMIPVFLFTGVYILAKGKNKRLETLFLLIIVLGGQVINEGIELLLESLHLLHPSITTAAPTAALPSEQASYIIVVYGLAAFFVVRYSTNHWGKTVASLSVMLIAFLVALHHVFFHIQNPSDLLAGYVLGGMWLSFSLVVMEVYRLRRV